MDWLALVSQIAGSATGQAMSGMDRAEAMALIKASVDEMGKINVPKLQGLVLQKQKGTGLANIKDDPQYRTQQSAADSQLNDVINSGGLTLADRAALNSIQRKLSKNASGANEAVANQMASRGTLDSGAQLSMELANNQNAAENAAAAGENTAGQAQARSFAAIQERARQAGAGLDRTYRQSSNAASAQDAINKGNTDIANTAAKYAAGIPQQDFENQMHLAQAKAQPGYALAGAKAANAQNTQSFWNGLGGIGAAAAKNGGSKNSNTGPGSDYSGSNLNTPSADGEGGFGSSPSDWQPYPTDSSALTSSSTRPDNSGPPPGFVLEGYTQDGKPRYVRDTAQQGQNF